MKAYITIRFLNEEYSGREYPPAPMRLLQAIVAATHGRETYLPVLRCMEVQAPVIHAVSPDGQYEYAHFVPNNDTYHEVIKGKMGRPRKGKKPPTRAEAEASTGSFDHLKAGVRKREIHRVYSRVPTHVIYEYEFPAELYILMQEALKRVHTLGRAGNLALANVSHDMPSGEFDVYKLKTTAQAWTSVVLRLPLRGSIDSVLAHWQNDRVPVRFKQVQYAKNPNKALPHVLFQVVSPVHITQTVSFVEEIRRAAMRFGIPNISGHEDPQDRLTIVPLPTLDWRDGMIRRAVITSPNQKMVDMAASRMFRVTDASGVPYLVPPESESDAVSSDYLCSSRSWVSVTPIILSGFDDHDKKKRWRVIERMREHAGLPPIVMLNEFPCPSTVTA